MIPLKVINLERSRDRWQNILEQTREFQNFKVERVDAIDGSKVKHDTFATNGMIGCFLSHRKAWQEFLNDATSDVCVIVEDDVEFIPDFERETLRALQTIGRYDPMWEFLYLGHIKSNPLIDTLLKIYTKNKCDTRTKVAGDIPTEFFVPCTIVGFHCYSITKKGAKFLLDSMTDFNSHVDVLLLKKYADMHVYALKNVVARQHQNVNTSTITTTEFPYVATRLAESWKSSDGTSYGYFLSVPIAQILQMKICGWTFILLFLLILAPFLPFNCKIIVLFYFLVELLILSIVLLKKFIFSK